MVTFSFIFVPKNDLTNSLPNLENKVTNMIINPTGTLIVNKNDAAVAIPLLV